jgi:glycosyltransferase involved in cell wall biosynthesis
MKVLMVNTPESPQYQGGDLVQMHKTAQALGRLGVEVAESFDPQPDCRGFDLAHVFNLRTVQQTPPQVRHLRQSGIPIVLSPLYLNPAVPLWAAGIVQTIFQSPREPAELAWLLDKFKTRSLRGQRPDGTAVAADTPNRAWPDYDRLQRETLAQVDHLLPSSVLELDQLVKTLRIVNIPFTIVPLAADSQTFLNADSRLFVDRYGLKDFVLQVGRIEPLKNQLLLVHSLRDTGLTVVLIGHALHADYLDWCRMHGPKDLRIFPYLPLVELASAYAAARVHALPSWIETCGLVTMEAALADCNVVDSISGCELEYFGDIPYYCDPADGDSIRTAVVKAFENHPRDAALRQRLKERILREYTWERAAETTYQAYCQVLERRASSAGPFATSSR